MTDTREAERLADQLRAVCGYQLRAHVQHQDGRDSLAPSLLFADADYEVGDGTCGIHADAKSANEPAIVYTRADALIDAIARAETAERERDEAREAIRGAVKLMHLDSWGADYGDGTERRDALFSCLDVLPEGRAALTGECTND